MAAFSPALAADPIFPPGVRVGITPLVGLMPAKTFAGFETEDHGVKVLVAELPADAYAEVMNAFKANPAGPAGVKPESIETAAGTAYYTIETGMNGPTSVKRYSMILPGGTFSGYIAVQVPENVSEDLHRRSGAADVRHGRDPQAGSGRRSSLHNCRSRSPRSPISRMSARWRPARPSSSPTPMKPPVSNPPPSW